jgi:small subunit ribosomal protein S18
MSTPYEPTNNDAGNAGTGSPTRRQHFRRRKTCPFTGKNASAIDYKDPRLLSRFITERGKIIPCRISAVSPSKQRELSMAIKRARFMALMPYVCE